MKQKANAEETKFVKKLLKEARKRGVNAGGFNEALKRLRAQRKENDAAAKMLGYKRVENKDGIARFEK